MSLAAGTRIGPYEITGSIGSGGMGEVYRARDTKLQRDVALKILPDTFAGDADRLVRFEREATTLAALNHPNIAQVHGLTEQPVALVMELVPGEDLAARLARGPIPLDETIAIARQLADALEAAHEEGIVHRDLKPANIKVRPDGTVKVLDFGLAKAVTGGSESAAESMQANSPTILSPAMTQVGVILGTAAYMSPEQARGKPVDRRADIWAFGCVLYEMLTGVAAFRGDDASMTIAAILTKDADFSRLPADLPHAIVRLGRRTLEKDPAKRLSWIGDARLELDEALSVPRHAVPHQTSTARLAVVAVIAAVAGGAAMWFAANRSASPAPTAAADFALRRLTELPGAEGSPDISPDGRQILYSSRAAGLSHIYLLRVGGARAINLTEGSTADNLQAAFSPNGELIAFRSDRDGGGIFVMGSTGESVRRVTKAGFDPAWSPDGKTLAYATEGALDPYARNSHSQLWTADVTTGQTTKIFDGDAIQPAWSPDGKHIAFWANRAGPRDVMVIAATGGTPVAVTNDDPTDWSPEWSADGRWLYFSSDRSGSMNVWRVAIAASGLPAGEPVPVTRSLTGVGYARLSADGSRMSVMAYARSFELSLADFDASGPGRLGTVTTIRSPSLGWCAPSPSGDWLACTARAAQEDIVLMRPDGSETIRLIDDAAKDRNPSWSPDGTRIGFMSSRTGRWELWSVRRDGSDLRQLTDLSSDIYEVIWAPVGTKLMTSATRPGTGSSAWLFDANSTARPATVTRLRAESPTEFAFEAWSPDMRHVAGSTLRQDGWPLGIAVMDSSTRKVRRYDMPLLQMLDGRGVAGWLPDSRRIVAATAGGLGVVDIQTGAWTKIEAPFAGTRYRLSADSKKLMIEREVFDGDVWLLEQKR